MKITNRKCPKCGCNSFMVNETFVETQSFTVLNGIVDFDGKDDLGNITKIVAECQNCGHVWKFRGENKYQWYKSDE